MLPSFMTRSAVTKSGKKVTHLQWWVSLLISMGLAIGTWNPTGIHFIGYMSQEGDLFSGFKPFYILVMFALWFLAFKSIFQSLKWYGVVIVLILIGAFLWGLEQYNLIDLSDLDQAGWAVTIGMGLLIWLGLNASIIWKKLTGVYTTDITDE